MAELPCDYHRSAHRVLHSTSLISIQRNVTMSRYAGKVGRRRKHDDRVAAALLDAAEELVQHGGVEGLSMRAVADRVGTTTRAVYTVYGSKAGLLAALGERTFDILGAGVAALPATDDPRADLVEAAPSLFRLGVQQVATPSEVIQRFRPSAQTAFAELERRIARLGVASVGDAALAFHALCEGRAAVWKPAESSVGCR